MENQANDGARIMCTREYEKSACVILEGVSSSWLHKKSRQLKKQSLLVATGLNIFTAHTHKCEALI
jgi:hypothetical protein